MAIVPKPSEEKEIPKEAPKYEEPKSPEPSPQLKDRTPKTPERALQPIFSLQNHPSPKSIIFNTKKIIKKKTPSPPTSAQAASVK